MTAATFAGQRVTGARANIPEWGCWYGEAAIDGEFTLSGRVELQIADLVLKGTVLSGGPDKGRSAYRIVAGAGGWGRTIKAFSYADDASTKVSKVVADAAAAAGETFDLTTIPNTARVGANFVRPEGPASSVLELVAPGAWYVGEDGITRLGKRPPGVLPAGVTHGPVDRAHGSVTLAGEVIASILPGLAVDGLVAVDVLHEISAKGGLRSTVWGAQSNPVLATFRKLVELCDPKRKFRGVTEYRVVSTENGRLILEPTQVSSGMPSIQRVTVRPGVAGCEAEVENGARVVVGFMNSEPGRPFVSSFEEAGGDGFMPTTLTLLKGVLGVARMTDTVQAGPFAGTITSASTKVKAG